MCSVNLCFFLSNGSITKKCRHSVIKVCWMTSLIFFNCSLKIFPFRHSINSFATNANMRISRDGQMYRCSNAWWITRHIHSHKLSAILKWIRDRCQNAWIDCVTIPKISIWNFSQTRQFAGFYSMENLHQRFDPLFWIEKMKFPRF